MARSGRPGRVQQIAYDATPLTAAQPDVDARIGWLLAMSRLHHTNTDFADGRTFIEALAEAGLNVSRSQISRWESGEAAVSYEATAAYERALGLLPGRLSSLTGYIRSAIPGIKARVLRPRLDPASREFALRLDELVDLAEDGGAKAADWQELGWHLSAAPLVHLRAATWQNLADEIVTIIPRSINVAYRQYSTAAMNLASIPRAQQYMTEAIAGHITTPGAQVLTNPIGLLDRLPTRGAAELVLDLIEDPPTETVFRLAVWVAAQKVAHGGFTPEERTRLDMAVLRLWRANPAKASEDLAELIAGLPEGLRSTLTSAALKAGRRRLGYVVETGEELVANAARSLSHDLAESARERVPQQAAYEEDVMLPRLVREAMFHRDSERRHLAALLISASPFNDAVADVLLKLLDRTDWPPLVRERAATLARYLSNDVHRMRMLRFLEDANDGVGTVIAQGIGHMTFSEFSDQVIRASLAEDWSLRQRAKMYALGMTGSPALEVIVRSRNSPEWQQEAARWWLAQGSAIRE